MKNISKQALEAYKTLLKYSQLSLNHQINFRNVNLKNDAHIHQIYTINNTKQQLPHLVLLHGFAGSAMSYIRTFHNLSKHFNVHALDHYGNGFSSRQTYDINKTQQQVLNLYVDSIQQWRKQTGIQKFVLAGHSFGGYIASSYMLENRNIVDRLVLLSPVGTSSPSSQIIILKKQYLLIFDLKNIQSEHLTFKVIQTPFYRGLFSGLVFKKYNKTIGLIKVDVETVHKIHFQPIKSFIKIFLSMFLMAICVQIDQYFINNIKNSSKLFYYGQNDWMEQVAAKKLSNKYSNVKYEIIQKATHNMVFDYPYDVVDRIIAGPMKNRIQLAKL